MVKPKRLAGLTLIELLISITILALLIGLASYSFSLFSRATAFTRVSSQKSLQEFQRLDLALAAVENSLPWVVRDQSQRLGFYFLGRDEGLTLVSGSPIFSPDGPAVIRFFREPDGPMRWKLVYEEAPLKGILLRSADQVLPFQDRMVVLTNLRNLEFRYFGWRSDEERLKSGDGDLPPGFIGEPAWYDEFDGISRAIQPLRVGIKLDDAEITFIIPERGDTAASRNREAL